MHAATPSNKADGTPYTRHFSPRRTVLLGLPAVNGILPSRASANSQFTILSRFSYYIITPFYVIFNINSRIFVNFFVQCS